MFHSGDIYEIRARASRHQELRRLARAITGLFHRAAPLHSGPETRSFGQTDCANDPALTARRAA
ncbi:hypothetical protein [Roseibium sp. Sym1]|uniref:hypothetical protein n=1 Tax=Roseibium sp. Sym1 TaxID=3016006 RepID=UPI0022B3DF2A|nr:hypothetical protein [Roseibium sp. Sym1]